MLILSPQERAQAWREAVAATSDDREYKRHMLASVAFQMLGSELSLYSDDYATALKDSFDLLDASGLIGRDDLREAFEEIDEQPGSARAFASSLGRLLRETALVARLSAAQRDRAGELAKTWRGAAADEVSGRVEGDGEVYVTVAEVAAIYDVTVQAVYKWIHRGVLAAAQRPGGSYQVPIDALRRDGRFDAARAHRLQQTLARRYEALEDISPDEMLDQIRSRRTSSR